MSYTKRHCVILLFFSNLVCDLKIGPSKYKIFKIKTLKNFNIGDVTCAYALDATPSICCSILAMNERYYP